MPYELKPLACDPAKLSGLSEKLIVSHWENNYGAAVKSLNAIERDFGGLDAWRAEFTAMGMGGGSGWTLLAWSPRRNRLVNARAADHAHNLAGATPLIALDMYEYSYHMDFVAKAGANVDAFMQNLFCTAAEVTFNAAYTKPGA